MIPVDAGEILDVFGPRVNILSSLELGEAELTLIAGTVDPGVIVPLHSHPDRELFCLTEGSIEAFATDQWHTISAGEVLAETGKHEDRRNRAKGPDACRPGR
jgi:quercetin dioxygenase-like cupin family protein